MVLKLIGIEIQKKTTNNGKLASIPWSMIHWLKINWKKKWKFEKKIGLKQNLRGLVMAVESQRVAEPLGSVATPIVRGPHRVNGGPPWGLRQQPGGSVGRVKLVSTHVAPSAPSRYQIYQVSRRTVCISNSLVVVANNFFNIRLGFSYCFHTRS